MKTYSLPPSILAVDRQGLWGTSRLWPCACAQPIDFQANSEQMIKPTKWTPELSNGWLIGWNCPTYVYYFKNLNYLPTLKNQETVPTHPDFHFWNISSQHWAHILWQPQWLGLHSHPHVQWPTPRPITQNPSCFSAMWPGREDNFSPSREGSESDLALSFGSSFSI